MPALSPTNPNLPSSWKIPGVYFSIDMSGSGAGVGQLNKRLLLIGYRLPTGTQPPDFPSQVNGQSDANDFFGQGSDLARFFAATRSHVGGGVLDIFCCGLNEPTAGLASTHLIAIEGIATETGSVDAYICGYRASVGIASGDAALAVAQSLKAEIDKLKDLPVTASLGGASGATIILTYRHKGATGLDLPVRVDQERASGVTFSPGAVTFANIATGAGSARLNVSTTSVTTPLLTGTAAADAAAALASAINAGGYPVRATVAGAVITLLYAKGRIVHKISASIITSTGITATAAVGVVPSDNAANHPSLTAALVNIAGQKGGFSVWGSSFTDLDSLGAISNHIEVQGNGLNQKGQFVHLGSTDALAVGGAIGPSTTPALAASPRYSVDWCPESPQQAYELAGRAAGMVCVEDYAPRNYDEQPLHTDSSNKVPLLLPHRAIRPPEEDVNAAINSYHLTPLVVDEASNTLVVVRGTTTFAGPDEDLHDWGVIRHLDFLRVSFNQKLSSLFSGKNARRNGTPRTANTVSIASVKDAIYVHAKSLDDLDLYDGAEQFKDAIKANFNTIVPSRIDCFIPLAVIRSLHQLGIVGAPQ